MAFKARKYKPPKCAYTINEDGTISTDGSIKNKISGTAMAAILGCSPWSSPFQIACYLLGLGKEDISDKPAVKAGNALEKKVINYLNERYPDIGTFLNAEQVYEERTGSHDTWKSDFDDERFAGHVDGIVMTEDGDDYILEIKTSGNLTSWIDGVPEHYRLQVELYNEFITDKPKAYVALGIVTQKERADPGLWVPSDDNVMLFPMDTDRDMIMERMAEASEWYDNTVAKGITPPYDPNNAGDVDLFTHLSTLTREIEEMATLVDKVAELDNKLAIAEAEVADIRIEENDLRTRLKDYMMNHNLEEIPATTGKYVAMVSTSTRRTLDKSLIREAGLDPDDYSKTKTIKSFTVKMAKKPQE